MGIEHCGLRSIFSELFDALIVSAAAKRLNLFLRTPIRRPRDVFRYEYRLVTSKRDKSPQIRVENELCMNYVRERARRRALGADRAPSRAARSLGSELISPILAEVRHPLLT
ncbi:hypothetical protein AB0F52_44155 [Amycolatopsis sp. NPDC024027]|uniref:hypothetical protein n=1 Tax=Amycolatopsis sp. NPDC024027 TaxID=3154327 RepID=UPI0033EFA26F